MNLLKTKLFCFLLFAPFFLQAQARDSTEVARAVDSLISDIDLRIQKNDFRMAKRICKDARQLAVETWGQRSEHEAKCMFQEARLLRATEQLDSSEHTYLAAGEILLSKFGATSDEYLSVVNNLSGLYKQMGRFVEAERLLNQILDACKSNPAIEESFCLKAEFNLGSVYRQLARYPESEAMLRSLLANPVFKNDTVQYRTALSTLASNYSILGKYQASDSLYQTVLAQYAASAGRESTEYARELTNLINVYDDRGDFTRAIDTASVALAIYKKNYGDNHPMYARTLSKTASVFAGIGDFGVGEGDEAPIVRPCVVKDIKDQPSFSVELALVDIADADFGVLLARGDDALDQGRKIGPDVELIG
jgi:tetratricopeptide (TPR) repeat protein